MPKSEVVVAIRYIGTERVDGLEYGLFPGYRYEVSLEEEVALVALYGDKIIRLEPSLETLPLLGSEETEPEPEKSAKKPATRKKAG